MRLALIVERFDPVGGGAERSTLQIARELQRRGHAVTILAGIAARNRPDDVPVESCLTARRLGVWGLCRFSGWTRRRLGSGDFDASLSVTTAAPASVLQPRSGTIRETLERNIALRPSGFRRVLKRLAIALSPKHQALLALERRTLADPMVRRVVAISGYVARQLRQHYRFDPQRLSIIPNAADMPAGDEAQRLLWRRDIRAAFGIGDASLTLLFCAYNPRLKGVTSLLRAVQRLAAAGLDVTVLLAGEIGYAEQQLAVHLGVRDRVRVVGRTELMSRLYCAADLTVLPTYYDPASKVVIESVMMGTPAVTTAYNGAADVVLGEASAAIDDPHQVRQRVRRGRCGYVVADPADVAGLAEAITALADPAERQRCRQAAAEVADSLSMSRHVDQLEQVLAASAR